MIYIEELWRFKDHFYYKSPGRNLRLLEERYPDIQFKSVSRVTYSSITCELDSLEEEREFALVLAFILSDGITIRVE